MQRFSVLWMLVPLLILVAFFPAPEPGIASGVQKATSLAVGITPVTGGVAGDCLIPAGGNILGQQACGLAFLTVGNTDIEGGTNGYCEYNNEGVLGEQSCTLPCATTVTTGTTATLSTCFTVNQEATAGAAITYTLPPASVSPYTLQFCADNGNNGSAPDTGTLELITSGSGQYIVFTDGTLSASGGYVISSGAARDGACVYGIDSTHWMFLSHSGVWTKH
jgi:hypothetical protein